MAVEIDVRLKDFYVPGSDTRVRLPTSVSQLAACAARVGRDVSWSTLRDPVLLLAERTWRSYMVRACLEERTTTTPPRMAASLAYRSLDGSEKGAVSFFLGQAMAQHVAEELFGCVLFAHLDGALSEVGMPVAGIRPDFIGRLASGGTIIVEAKGRTGGSSKRVLERAKDQTRALPAAAGDTTRYGSLTYFTPGDELRVVMLDPEGDDEPTIDLLRIVLSYYDRLLALVNRADARPYSNGQTVYRVVSMGSAGVTLGLDERTIRDLEALRSGTLSVDEFTQQLVARHRDPTGPLPSQRLGESSPRALMQALRGRETAKRFRSELRAELRQQEQAVREVGGIRFADGTMALLAEPGAQ